ncbi:hypothetical protein BDDG_13718, partial [Blastomyces dermatitidis ATCC 18188]
SDIMKIESLCEICFYQKLRDLIFLKIIFICLIYTDYLLDDIKTITYHSCVTLTVRDTQLMMNIIKTLR